MRYSRTHLHCPTGDCQEEVEVGATPYVDERGRTVEIEVLDAPCGHRDYELLTERWIEMQEGPRW